MGLARSRFRVAVAGFVALIAATCFTSVAVAAPGDVYVADEDGGPAQFGAILKVGPTGGDPQVLSEIPDGSTTEPSGMALDQRGVLYFTGFDEAVHTADRVTGALGTFATIPGAQLADVAVGPDQNVYVTDTSGDGSLLRIDHLTKAVTQLASDFTTTSSPYGLAVARDGTVYVSDQELTIYRVTPTGGVSTFAATPFLSGADGLALSPDDNTLYVASFGSPDGDCCEPPNSISKIDVGSGIVTRLLDTDDSVAVSLFPDGSLLNSDTDDSEGFEGLQRVTGSTLSTFSQSSNYSYPHDTVIEPENCGGLFPNVVGTTGADNLVGSPFADVISTLGGKDTVKGGGGGDVICGGTGKDKLFGQAGRDRLLGQSGKDQLNGGKGKDLLKGGGGKDRCRAGKGDKLRSCLTKKKK